MSLADELAADLDFDQNDSPHRYDEEEEEEMNMQAEADAQEMAMAENGAMDEDDDYIEGNEANIANEPMLKHKDVRQVAKMMGSRQMTDVLQQIKHYKQSKRTSVSGHIEDDPEYQLIVSANNLAAEIDNEIAIVHKFVRDHYASKFAELERLVTNPFEYVKTVKLIGNETDVLKINLDTILPRASVMMVHVAAATSNGEPLSDAEWSAIERACDMALELDNARATIMDYVESRMAFMAPNLCAVVGSRTAAQLIGAAGGLLALMKIPSCNLFLLGAQKRTSEAAGGFGAAVTKPHTGYIFRSEMVQSLPVDVRRKAQKIIADKATLAARVDQSHDVRDGSYGAKLREAIDTKIEKILEPPAHAQIRALPIPDEGPKKRRGGRKARAAKGKYAMTELSKAQNRMAFGTAEEEINVGDETEGLGMVGVNSGRIRAAAADSRSKAKISKATRAKQLRYSSSSNNVSGLASSVAFTPVQGIELVDPSRIQQQKEKVKNRYFGT